MALGGESRKKHTVERVRRAEKMVETGKLPHGQEGVPISAVSGWVITQNQKKAPVINVRLLHTVAILPLHVTSFIGLYRGDRSVRGHLSADPLTRQVMMFQVSPKVRWTGLTAFWMAVHTENISVQIPYI